MEDTQRTDADFESRYTEKILHHMREAFRNGDDEVFNALTTRHLTSCSLDGIKSDISDKYLKELHLYILVKNSRNPIQALKVVSEMLRVNLLHASPVLKTWLKNNVFKLARRTRVV